MAESSDFSVDGTEFVIDGANVTSSRAGVKRCKRFDDPVVRVLKSLNQYVAPGTVEIALRAS